MMGKKADICEKKTEVMVFPLHDEQGDEVGVNLDSGFKALSPTHARLVAAALLEIADEVAAVKAAKRKRK